MIGTGAIRGVLEGGVVVAIGCWLGRIVSMLLLLLLSFLVVVGVELEGSFVEEEGEEEEEVPNKFHTIPPTARNKLPIPPGSAC